MVFCFVAPSTIFFFYLQPSDGVDGVRWYVELPRLFIWSMTHIFNSEVFVCAQNLRSLSDALWVTTSVVMCHVNFLLIRTTSEIFGCYILVSKRNSVITQIIPMLKKANYSLYCAWKITYLVKESPVSCTASLQEDAPAEEMKKMFFEPPIDLARHVNTVID
jgi:hypothetical protein